jgi:glycosyltransferase involved in cell wall biosynthesis
MTDYMQRAKAFVFAAEEDFGITPVEAQACGTPVIAFGKGGSLETIRSLENQHPTGVFFEQQTVDSLVEAVNVFVRNQDSIEPSNCRSNALRFSEMRFKRKLMNTSIINGVSSWIQRVNMFSIFCEINHREA